MAAGVTLSSQGLLFQFLDFSLDLMVIGFIIPNK